MTATWPLTLPQSFLVDSFGEEAPNNIIRSAMEAGPAKTRRRFTATVEPFTGKMIMTPAQYQDFKDFFRNIIQDGALEFQMNDYVDGGTMIVMFRDVPRSTFLGTVWEVTMSLEKQP